MRLRPILLALCLLSLSALMVLPAHAQVTVPVNPAYPELDIQGAPQFQVWPTGYFIWTDSQGFHVRWNSAPGQAHQFSGDVAVQGTIAYFQPTYPNRPDAARRQGNRLIWNAYNPGGGDGFNFAINPGDVVTFSMLIDGRMASRNEIYLGANAFHPSTNPFAFSFGGPVPIGGGGADRWPAYVRGQPAINLTNRPMYFLWLDDAGWHLRWTTRRFGREAAGLMSTDGRFNEFRRVSLEEGDQVARGDGLVAWETRTGRAVRVADRPGDMDGIDFRTTGQRLSFTLLMDGDPIPTDQIFIGASGTHPRNNPFRIMR
jgi:hypothetical protein